MTTSVSSRRPRILLGITGSVAAVKGPALAVRLARDLKADVRVLLTRGGENFWEKAAEYDPTSWEDFSARFIVAGTSIFSGDKASGGSNVAEVGEKGSNDNVRVMQVEGEGSIFLHYADDEWKGWNRLGDPVLHIDLRDWADIAIIAPLSAHTLAKLATGMSDDTLSCCIRAWDFGRGIRPGKPLILAPAMNTAMWEHPLTKSQLDTVRGFWKEGHEPNRIDIVNPQVKTLACGEVGAGALASLEEILRVTQECIDQSVQGFFRENREQSKKDRIRRALISLAKVRFQEQQGQTLEIAGSKFSPLVAPISPTPNELVSLVIPRLNLTPSSLLLDLGCGDGRWVVAASLESGCRCIGCDLDPKRMDIARKDVEKHRLGDRIALHHTDVFEVAKSDALLDADVIVMYLFREAMQKMSDILQGRLISASQSRKEVKIISVGFALPSWRPVWQEECNNIRVYMYNTNLAPGAAAI